MTTKPCRYFPFRYTSQGKYAGKRVLINHRVREEWVVFLLAYTPFLPSLDQGMDWVSAFAEFWTLFWLFVSFNAIYEIGYYDNDFLAAKKEAKPTLSPTIEPFASYPIHRMGWIWGIGCGAMAFIPSTLTYYTNALTPALQAFGTALGTWTLLLIATRLLFCLHNQLPEHRRTLSFAGLHLAKLTIYGVFITISPLGWPLIIAQAMRHITPYALYRQGKDVAHYRRQSHRLCWLFAGLTLLLIWTPSLLTDAPIQLSLTLLWAIYRAGMERYRSKISVRALFSPIFSHK